MLKGALCVPTFSNVKESWVLFSPEYLLLMGLWVWPTTGMHIVFENYQMPTHKPFLDPWPWLGHSDVFKVRWWLLPFTRQGWLPIPIAGWLALDYEALPPRNISSIATARSTGWLLVNSSSPGKNGHRFADDIFRYIVTNEKNCILIRNSLIFVPKGPINNNPALV